MMEFPTFPEKMQHSSVDENFVNRYVKILLFCKNEKSILTLSALVCYN